MDTILIDITGFVPNKKLWSTDFYFKALKELDLNNDSSLIIICSKKAKEFLKFKT